MDNETLPQLPEPDVVDPGRFGCAWMQPKVTAYALAARADLDEKIMEAAEHVQSVDEENFHLKRHVEELEQSVEVAARNMRDLVAEHVRERDALSERVRELDEQMTDMGSTACSGWTRDTMSRSPHEWVEVLLWERDALRARLEAIRKQPTVAYADKDFSNAEVSEYVTKDSPFFVKELIERPELP